MFPDSGSGEERSLQSEKDTMKVIGVIPARWASTRFPGKVLADLNGKPMIRYVWQQSKKARRLDEVIIACDDEKVAEVCLSFGAQAVMTSADHQSGTDRIIEAVRDRDADIVVNIQGDEPLIAPEIIDDLAKALKDDEITPVATVVKRIEHQEELSDPNIVKAVIDENGFALYFSRHAIPFNRDNRPFSDLTVYKHLGLYAYRWNFLSAFKDLTPSLLEKTEKLEQLRVLEAGYKIKTIRTDFETIGVDTPGDLERAAKQLTGDIHG